MRVHDVAGHAVDGRGRVVGPDAGNGRRLNCGDGIKLRAPPWQRTQKLFGTDGIRGVANQDPHDGRGGAAPRPGGRAALPAPVASRAHRHRQGHAAVGLHAGERARRPGSSRRAPTSCWWGRCRRRASRSSRRRCAPTRASSSAPRTTPTRTTASRSSPPTASSCPTRSRPTSSGAWSDIAAGNGGRAEAPAPSARRCASRTRAAATCSSSSTSSPRSARSTASRSSSTARTAPPIRWRRRSSRSWAPR